MIKGTNRSQIKKVTKKNRKRNLGDGGDAPLREPAERRDGIWLRFGPWVPERHPVRVPRRRDVDVGHVDGGETVAPRDVAQGRVRDALR